MTIKLAKYEKRNYVMKDNEDKEIIKLIRLKDDWKIPLINYLNKLLMRYQK